MLIQILIVVGLAVILFLFVFFLKPFRGNKIAEPAQTDTPTFIQTDSRKATEDPNDMPEEELVAVLTAAVLAAMRPAPDCKLKITSFRRIPQISPIWNAFGRSEYLSNKL